MMDAERIASLLANTEACRDLLPEELAAIAQAGKVSMIWEGDDLMTEGDIGDTMALILDGELKVIKADQNGRVREISTVGPGTMLGEIALVDGLPRTATVRATKPVRFFTLERAALGSLLASGERAAIRMLVSIARTLARRQAATSERLVAALVELSQRGEPAENVDAFLKDLVIEVEC